MLTKNVGVGVLKMCKGLVGMVSCSPAKVAVIARGLKTRFGVCGDSIVFASMT